MPTKKTIKTAIGNEFVQQIRLHHLNMKPDGLKSSLDFTFLSVYDGNIFHNEKQSLSPSASSEELEALYGRMEQEAIEAFSRIIELPIGILNITPKPKTSIMARIRQWLKSIVVKLRG